MCIAILKTKDVTLSDWVFSNSFAWHPDGAGFIVHDEIDNSLTMKKGFFTLEGFMDAFDKYNSNKYTAVIHFRKSTHGRKNRENCHPFMVNDNLGFVHNGVIRSVKLYNKGMSDTWHFCESIMRPLVDEYPDIWTSPTMRFLIEEFISGYSKLVFLSNEGEYEIYNEDKGIWDDGCWFSNDTYKYDPKNIDVLAGNKKAFERVWENHKLTKADKDKTMLVYYAEMQGLLKAQTA